MEEEKVIASNPVFKPVSLPDFQNGDDNIPAGEHLLPRTGVYNAMGILCEAFPYRPLGHLGNHAKQFKNNEPLCVELLCQLAAALGTLHAEGIQHRDVKPENILVASLDPLNIELADFGSAEHSSMTVDVTNAGGTLRYIAPEAAMGTYTKTSDWYSVGLIIAELYTGIKIRSDEVTLYRVAQGKDRLPNTLAASPALDRVVKGLLDPDFRSRWQTSQVKNWLKAPAGEGTVRETHRAQKKVLAALGIAALAVVVIAIVTIATLSHLPEIGKIIGSWFSSQTPETEGQTQMDTLAEVLPKALGIIKWILLIGCGGTGVLRMATARGDVNGIKEGIALAMMGFVAMLLFSILSWILGT